MLLLVAPGRLDAQEPAGGTIRGTVFDSLLARGPLAGATVVLQGTDRTVLTDRRGRFEFTGLAAGRHLLGFFHPTLDSLDIAAPGRIVLLGAGELLEVTLGTPSPDGVSRLLCRRPAETATAVLFGTVRAAEDGAPLEGAEALVRWFEVEIGAQGARQRERVAQDSTDAEGRYLLCGVPNDIALTLVATHDGQATGPLHLELDSTGVARRDLQVSRTDPAARRLPATAPDDTVPVGRVMGTGALRVRVLGATGRGLASAIVGVRGTTIADVTDSAGVAFLRGLPAGSQTVVVRAIGLLPQHRLVSLAPGTTREETLRLDRSVTLLPAVAVVGQRRDPLTLDIARRLRTGQGRLVEGAQLEDLKAAPSAWARLPGVTIGAEADPMPLMRGQLGGRCRAEVWVDGMRMTNIAGWELRGLLLNATRVEVYNTASRVPPEFTTVSMDPCGAVLLWTR